MEEGESGDWTLSPIHTGLPVNKDPLCRTINDKRVSECCSSENTNKVSEYKEYHLVETHRPHIIVHCFPPSVHEKVLLRFVF